MTRRFRRTGAALAVGVGGLLTASSLSACSLGSKQTMTNSIVASAFRAIGKGTAKGSLDVSVSLVKSTQPTVPGPPRILPAAVTSVPAELDLIASRASVGTVGTDSTPALIFDGSRMYLHRADKPASSGGAVTNVLSVGGTPVASANPAAGGAQALAAALLPQRSTAAAPAQAKPGAANRRPWLELDYAALARKDTNRTAGSLAMNPDLMVLMLKGTLTGSVRRVGVENVAGANAVHYKMNISVDKTESGFPDSVRQLIDKILRANAIHGRVFKAEAWIGEDGLPRRILLNFRQQLDADARADFKVQLDLTAFGGPPSVQDPGADQIAKVTSLGQLVHAAEAGS